MIEAIRAGAVNYADVAEDCDMNRSSVRRVVRRLCRRYRVGMRELPAAVDHEAGRV